MSYELLNCEVCGTSFYAKTRKAKYCSPGCKQKNWRINNDAKNTNKRLYEAQTLTFDEKAFVDAVSSIDSKMGECIWDAIQNGDIAFVKALYAVTRYEKRFDELLMSGFAVCFPDVMKREKDVILGWIPF